MSGAIGVLKTVSVPPSVAAMIPELIFENLEIENMPKAIKPIIDSTWNAAGFSRSDYYAENGNWIGERGLERL